MSYKAILAVMGFLFGAACTHKEELRTDPHSNQKSSITVCQSSSADEVKAFLGIDLDQNIEINALLKNAVDRGYLVDYRMYYVLDPDCYDQTLAGSNQYFVTAGWGKDRNGGNVFRAFVISSDTNGRVTRVESRYSYRW